MSAFEIVFLYLAAPFVYAIVYLAGKCDLLKAMIQILVEKAHKWEEEDHEE